MGGGQVSDCTDHQWGEVEHSRLAGTAHRKCQNCRVITLDLYDDDLCDECQDPLDDGEGWNGLCGNCADRRERRGLN